MSREHAIIAAIAFFAAGAAFAALILSLRRWRRDARGPLPRRKHPVPAPLATVVQLVRDEPERPLRATGTTGARS
jgi:hypothetical protein